MPIKFLLDKAHKEQEETIKRILEVVRKQPYPDQQTGHLATFVHALFQVSPKSRQFTATMTKHRAFFEPIAKEPAKEVVRYVKKPLPPPPRPIRSTPSNLLPPEIVKSVKIPEPASANAKKTEYTVLSFDTPIGIISDPNGENNKPTYTVIEPQVSFELLNKINELVEKDVGKDYKILDDADYLKEKCQKAARKLKIPFADEMLQPIKYFLKRNLTGFRKLDPLMQDLDVKAIFIEGVNKPVIVETSQYAKGKTNITFGKAEELNSLIKKIAKATDNEISEDKPILDTVFQGFKIQAILGKGEAASKLIIKKVMA